MFDIKRERKQMTLFGILKQLHSSGVLETRERVNPVFGIGEVFLFSGAPLKIYTGVTGSILKWAPNTTPERYYDFPHDIAVTSDGRLFTEAPH